MREPTPSEAASRNRFGERGKDELTYRGEGDISRHFGRFGRSTSSAITPWLRPAGETNYLSVICLVEAALASLTWKQ
jgi:hypothetical protein